MPFQLNTGIYNTGGGDGGGSRQTSPFGQLGALMELQMRRESLESQKDARALINEQRQQAIDKIEAAKKGEVGANEILQKNPWATAAELAPHIGWEKAQKFEKDRDERETARVKYIANAIESVKAYDGKPEQEQKFYEMQDHLVNTNRMTQDQMQVYSPEAVNQIGNMAMSVVEQRAAVTAKQHADAQTAEQKRLTDAAPTKLMKEKADALEAARKNIVPLLQNAQTPAAYKAVYDSADPLIQGSLPTVEDWTKDPKRANTKLGALGLTPAETAQQAASAAQRAMMERHHRQSEARLEKQYGAGALTSTMYQTAKKRRDDDEQRLSERVADARRQGKPFTEAEEKDERFRIQQAFDSEMRLPPSLPLADQRKKNLYDALEKDFIERNKKIKVEGQPDEPPRNPMSKEELEEGKKAIQYQYRSWFGLGPEPIAGAGQLGAMVNPQPPQVAPPPVATPPLAGRGAAPAAAAPTLPDVEKQIKALRAASGNSPTADQRAEYARLRALQLQLGGR